MPINGIYSDGITSKQHSACLEVINISNQLLRIHLIGAESKEEITFYYQNSEISSRLGNTPREVSFGESQQFVTEDNDGIDQINQSFNQQPSIIHKLETNFPAICLSLILTVTFIWGMVSYGIPASSKYIAFNMPAVIENSSRNSLSILDKTLFEPSKISIKRQEEIHTLVAPYFRQYGDIDPRLEFRSGMQANALALPGNIIVFTDDFINLIKDDNELLAIMFHEIGHLKHKHITRRVIQDMIMTLLTIFIFGDIDSIDLATGLPTLLLDLTYSRKFEIEADTFALKEMKRFNMDIDHFSSVMKQLEQYYVKQENPSAEEASRMFPDFLSTHPSTKDRLYLIERYKITPHQ